MPNHINPAAKIPKSVELTILLRLSRESRPLDAYYLPHLRSIDARLNAMVRKGWIGESASSNGPGKTAYRLMAKGKKIVEAVKALEKACK